MAQPAVFISYYGTQFLPPKHPDIHQVMTDSASTVDFFSELVRNHKHKVWIFNKYNVVYRMWKRVISQLIPEKFYNSLASQTISFAKFTCLNIWIYLITKFVELEDDDIQETD